MMLRPSRLFWKLFIGTTFLIVLILGACTWIILMKVRQFHEEELTEQLKAQGIMISGLVRDMFDRGHAAELDRFAKQRGSDVRNRFRITMILPDGTVLADSQANPSEMESHADRKEVRQALAAGWGEDTHYSRTVSRDMKYVATRVGTADAPAGIVRISMPLRTISQQTEAIQDLILTIAFLGLFAAVLFALGLAILWSNPIRRITMIARSLSRGDLSARAHVSGQDELALLAGALNEMREHLANQLETIDRQRRTLESLLAQLHEGVVVAGPDGKILLINPAAIRFLRPSADKSETPSSLVGLAVEQCVSQYELQGILLRSPDAGETTGEKIDSTPAGPAVREIRIRTCDENGGLLLLARASDLVLPGFEQESGAPLTHSRRLIGQMLVLTDITELDRAAQIKMDFASNASHELRTPLSAIRAAVETLMDMDLKEDQESAKHFLGVIDRHSSRMEQMVSDLLDLSKIESSPTQFKPQVVDLTQLLEELHGRYLDRLHAKPLHWTVDVPAELGLIKANPYLLHTILDNLLDNAVKFSAQEGRISVMCREAANDVIGRGALSIIVADTGCGIPQDQLDRVFERFYQVEAARSTANRGTGLGLSIVRHAVAAMHGTVHLDSRLGQGTQVTITIPKQG